MRSATFSGAIRDFVGSGAGADLSGSPLMSPASWPSITFSDLPIGSVLFPTQKTRAQLVKVDRSDVSYQENEMRNEHDVASAVKTFTNNVLLNSNFIDTKKKPKVLITVTGGAGAYVIPPAVEPIFCKGLMKAARATNAWIVTGGTDSGVMKAVGEAYRKHSVENVPCIGIASYNALNNKQILMPSNKTIEYSTIPGGGPPLNPYHTHFVLVDGQKYMKNEKDIFGHEIEFRSDLESFLCSEEMFDIPLLLVVVGGGPGTLKTVYEGVVRKFPVVVINKTGGVADAISYRIQQKTDPTKRAERDEWEAWSKNPAVTITADHEKYMDMIVEDSGFVQIYDPTSKISLEVFLFRSIFNCDKYGGFNSKMELAVSCNQLEVVNGLLAGVPLEEKPEKMTRTMQFAVQSDRADIFDALIEQTANRSLDLHKLYKFIFTKRSRWARFYPILSQKTISQLEKTQSFIKQESKQSFKEKEILASAEIPLTEMPRPSSAKDVRNPMINPLLQFFLSDLFFRSGRIYDYYRDALSLRLGLTQDTSVFEDMKPKERAKATVSKLSDVMLWALLMGYRELAQTIWTHTNMPTHTALIASHFCKLLAKRFANEGPGYLELSAEFENKAIQLLEKMSYKEAKAVLAYQHNEFKLNLLEIADLAETKEFTSQPYVQRYVDELLFRNKYGELPPSTSNWKIVLCIIPFFWFWIYHPNLKNNERIKEGKYSRFMYYSLPIVKFWTNTICYIGFIVLCSYVLIVSDPKVYSISGAEVLLFIWMAALLVEEGSQLLEDGPVQYLSRVSNQIDMLMLVLFTAFFVLKLVASSNKNETVLIVATDIFVVATIIVYLRLLNMFAFSPQLGPLYFVVLRCVDDVIHWLFIFVLFCFGCTIAIIVCVKQNGGDPFKPFTEDGSFAVAFYTIVGEFTAAFPDLIGNGFGLVILAIYALIAQIVLVNLLIAMMGDTFNTVKEDSAKEWRFNRYSLATEYSSTSAIAPPFNIIIAPIKTLVHLFRAPTKVKKAPHEVPVRRLKSLSRKFVEEILDDEKEKKKKDLEHIADSLKATIKKMGNKTSQTLGKIEGLVDGGPRPLSATASSSNINLNMGGGGGGAGGDAILADIQKNMAALKESVRPKSSKPTNSFAVQLPQKMLSFVLEEGVSKELGQRAVREFGPLASFIKVISTSESQWDVQEVIIHSIDTAADGSISFVRFSTKMGCWEGKR